MDTSLKYLFLAILLQQTQAIIIANGHEDNCVICCFGVFPEIKRQYSAFIVTIPTYYIWTLLNGDYCYNKEFSYFYRRASEPKLHDWTGN